MPPPFLSSANSSSLANTASIPLPPLAHSFAVWQRQCVLLRLQYLGLIASKEGYESVPPREPIECINGHKYSWQDFTFGSAYNLQTSVENHLAISETEIGSGERYRYLGLDVPHYD